MDELASLGGGEGLLLDPAEEGRASLNEANSTDVSKRVLWATEEPSAARQPYLAIIPSILPAAYLQPVHFRD